MPRKLIYLTSPYGAPDQAGIDRNLAFAKKAARTMALAGYTPVIVHLMYPAILDDKNQEERALGISMDFQLLEKCDVLAYYVCNGVSNGMDQEIRHALEIGLPVYRMEQIGGRPLLVHDVTEYENLLSIDAKRKGAPGHA